MFHRMQKKKGKGGMNDALLEKERDQLANALERLADVQRELAEGQRSLMTGLSLQPLAAAWGKPLHMWYMIALTEAPGRYMTACE